MFFELRREKNWYENIFNHIVLIIFILSFFNIKNNKNYEFKKKLRLFI